MAGESFSALVRTVGQRAGAARFFSRDSLLRLRGNISQAALPFTAQEFLSFSLAASAAVSLLAFPCALLALDFFGSAAVGLLLFSASFFALLRFPAHLAKARGARIERDLSVALRAVHASMMFNPNFEKSLEFASRGGFGELSAELSRVLQDCSRGMPMNDALREFGERVDSVHAKRAAAQLAFAYEYGLTGEGLQKLASELSSMQRAQAREFAAKTAFSGMLFITSSCIIPAFFSAYASVGSLFLDTRLSPQDVMAAFLLVFPAINAAILLFAKSRSPPTITSA